MCFGCRTHCLPPLTVFAGVVVPQAPREVDRAANQRRRGLQKAPLAWLVPLLLLLLLLGGRRLALLLLGAAGGSSARLLNGR